MQRAVATTLRLPDLSGTLVTVEDHEECRLCRAPRIAAAQCFLLPYATQHLRYHLEPEFDLLMAYVRHFHMPTLEYWRYRTLPHFTEYRKWATALRNLPKQGRTIADALERWREATRWRHPTEWDQHRLSEETRGRLEAEGTVEGIATGVLIDLLRSAH